MQSGIFNGFGINGGLAQFKPVRRNPRFSCPLQPRSLRLVRPGISEISANCLELCPRVVLSVLVDGSCPPGGPILEELMNLADDLGALPNLTMAQLRHRFAKLFGEASHATNKIWLI